MRDTRKNAVEKKKRVCYRERGLRGRLPTEKGGVGDVFAWGVFEKRTWWMSLQIVVRYEGSVSGAGHQKAVSKGSPSPPRIRRP